MKQHAGDEHGQRILIGDKPVDDLGSGVGKVAPPRPRQKAEVRSDLLVRKTQDDDKNATVRSSVALSIIPIRHRKPQEQQRCYHFSRELKCKQLKALKSM
jgi:hypothetical protein